MVSIFYCLLSKIHMRNVVKFIASIASSAGLPHGSDVLLLGNLISCFAEKPLQFDLSPQSALHSFLIFFFFNLDESQFNKMLFPAQFLCHWRSHMNVLGFFSWVQISVSALRFPSAPQDRPHEPRVCLKTAPVLSAAHP